jgi:hydrogenase expression/formation protein HypE
MSEAFVPSDLFLRVERQRRQKPKIRDERITLAHGSGGKAMHDLIEGLFLAYLHNPLQETLEDQAVFELGDHGRGIRLAFTTDSFVVTPIFFPGGDIGSLAIHGTVNDLAMSGARPLYLSAGFILEEGFPTDTLRCILASMQAAAEQAGVYVVTGDTKVVSQGAADQIFINTSGIGIIEQPLHISSSRAQVGDKVILSGSLGDHGVTVLVARGDLALETEIRSDTAPLWSLVHDMLGVSTDIHCLRDPTRGGVGTTLNEMAISSEVGIAIEECYIPVRDEVRGACEILGLDPLYVANEGKLIAIVAAEVADRMVDKMRQHPLGREARMIGEVQAEPPGIVMLKTAFGGTRIVDMLVGEQLPRIC